MIKSIRPVLKTITLTFFACLLFVNAFAQLSYSSFTLHGNDVYRLNYGVLKINDENGNLKKVVKHGVAIKSISFDRDNNLVTIDAKNNIRKLLKDNKWTSIGNYGRTVYGVGFNSKNQCFVATDGGIVDRDSGKIYRPDSTLFHSEWSSMHVHRGDLKQEYAVSPVFVDSFDVLWTSVSHGEWGDDVFAFNTITKEFINVFTSLLPSIEVDKNLYAVGQNDFSFYVSKLSPVVTNGKLSFKTNMVYNIDKDKGLGKNKGFAAFDISGYAYDNIRNKIYIIYRNQIYMASTKVKFSGYKSFQPVTKLNSSLPKLKSNILNDGYHNLIVSPNGNITLLSFNGLIIYDGKKLRIVK